MSIYTEILRDYTDVRDKLPPVICDRCKQEGYGYYGECPTCLRNYATAKEWLETHTFPVPSGVGCYHSCRHDSLKKLPLRLPHEHPLLYYGVELEIGFDGYHVWAHDDEENDEEITEEMQDIVTKALDILGMRAVVEEDSTIDNGVEFILPPCSYQYLTHPDTQKRIQAFFDYLLDHGALVDQPSGHGMHIHISQRFFENHARLHDTLSDAEITNFEWFFQKFQPEIEQLAGRPYGAYRQSKIGMAQHSLRSQINGVMATQFKLEKGASGVPCDDHNYAVILSGNTVEARVFKSTLDLTQFYANIEMVRNFAHAARENTAGQTLDSILHTKENLYLDAHIQKTRMDNSKSPLALTRVDSDNITFTLEDN